MNDAEIGIGEAAHRERLRRQKRLQILLITGMAVAVLIVPLALGLWAGLSGAQSSEPPRWLSFTVVALLMTVAAAGGVLGWRWADELKRRRAINSAAAAGAFALLAFPLTRAWNASFAVQIDFTIIGLGAAIVCLIAILYQRWRG